MTALPIALDLGPLLGQSQWPVLLTLGLQFAAFVVVVVLLLKVLKKLNH